MTSTILTGDALEMLKTIEKAAQSTLASPARLTTALGITAWMDKSGLKKRLSSTSTNWLPVFREVRRAF